MSHAALTRDDLFVLVKPMGKKHSLDLSGCDLSGVNLGGEEVVWENIIFGRHGGLPPASLRGALFRKSTLKHCFFAHTDLTDVDFRHCHLVRCDFRYAQFHRTTFEEAIFDECDFYRSMFLQGTIMRGSIFKLVSLTASLDGATALRWSTFKGKDGKPALVPESEPDYRAFLEWTKKDRLETYSIPDAVRDRLLVAAESYRSVSALWTSRGQFGDADQAYVRARRLERQSAGWLFKGQRFRPVAWLWLWFLDLLCGFGTNLWKIIPWLAAVVIVPALCYLLFGGVSDAHGFGQDLLFSAAQMTDATPVKVGSAAHIVDVVGVAQRVAGVALIGLFGFVLGNKIRSS